MTRPLLCSGAKGRKLSGEAPMSNGLQPMPNKQAAAPLDEMRMGLCRKPTAPERADPP